MKTIETLLALYFVTFLCYWIISSVIRAVKNSPPRTQKFKVAKYLFFVVFIVIAILAYTDDNQIKKDDVEQFKKEYLEKQQELAKSEQITINRSYDIEPMKKQLIEGKIDHAKIRRFIMQDSVEFLATNAIESIDSVDFIDCMNLNIFSNDFNAQGKTDLAPIRDVCYKELKEGNPFKKAYRGLDPFSEYSMLGNMIKNVSNNDFKIIRSGMKKNINGTVSLFVVWHGFYKRDYGDFGVTEMIKDYKTVENSFDIGDINIFKNDDL